MSKNTRLFGLHAVTTVLRHQPERVHRLWAQKTRRDSRIKELSQLAETAGIVSEPVSRAALDELAGSTRHQGVVANIAPRTTGGERALAAFLDKLTEPAFLLILDSVQDPHNLGACMRSADAAGVHAVAVPRDRAASLTSTVSKVASGAAEIVPFFAVANLARTLRVLRERGIWIYGAASEAAESLYATDLTGPIAIVLGAEGKGLRRLTREHCDGLVRVPMLGSVESLNVSVAAGVILFEVLRQRQAGDR